MEHIKSFDNVNHPEVAYWFFSKDMLKAARYKEKIDSLANYSKYTLVFLTARNGVNFYDKGLIYPVFKDLVAYAHLKGLKIGLQLWDNKAPVALENTERIIQEGEITLDVNGRGNYTVDAKHVRDMKALIKSELFKVYLFKKSGEGFYRTETWKDLTNDVKASESKTTVSLSLDVGTKFKGYTAYILSQHYYNFSSNHSADAVNRLKDGLAAYADIPFDAVGLDEFTNLRVATTGELTKSNEVFRERSYSLAMAAEFKKMTGLDLDRTLFDMRYAPVGNPQIRIKAINAYMRMMREGTMHVEHAIYDYGKRYFGEHTFIGLHETHHNSLSGDEIWQTGLNWWNVPRDYGHTDESSPTPTQLGIGMGYRMNIMYNMYYSKSLDAIFEKALTDLRYGIRTHYHAINDIQGWGVSVEKPESLSQINKVENAARLLNHFNPSFPQVKLLVVFGMEALCNWYPDPKKRGLSDINDQLYIEEKTKLLWDAGYLNVLVPSDMINDDRLHISADGKPVLMGHQFDAIVYLYPQFATTKTLQFLTDFEAKGGKLMIEGSATYDADGNDITHRWQKIRELATVDHFSVDEIPLLGITKNKLDNGVINEDQSYVFTDVSSLKNNKVASFAFTQNGWTFSGSYTGLTAIKIDQKGNIEKLAATGLSVLKKDGKTLLSFERPVDVLIERFNGQAKITVADQLKNVKMLVNNL